MAGPATIADYQTTTWSGLQGPNVTTPALAWQSGDLIVAVGVTEDSGETISTPTATGLTFSLTTSVGGANNTFAYLWTATAGSAGPAVVTANGTNGKSYGIAAFTVRDHNGAGTPATINGTSARTISLAVADSSSVVVAVFADWNAASVGTAASPTTNGTLRQAVQVSGRATFHLVSWTAQAAGTRGYGYSGGGTPDNNGIVIEVKGSSAATATAPPPLRRRTRFFRRAF